MPLGMKIGLGPGHIVLDKDPAPHPRKGAQPPIFGPRLLWTNGCVDQESTWYDDRPRHGQHCARYGPSLTPKGHNPSTFGPCLLWPNCWMDEGATWSSDMPRLRPRCVTWGSSSPSQKGHSPLSNFRPLSRPLSIVTKRSPISATADHLLTLFFGSRRAQTSKLILTIRHVFSRNEVPIGDVMKQLPIWGRIPKFPFWGLNRRFQA